MDATFSSQNPHEDFILNLNMGELLCEIELDRKFRDKLTALDSEKHNHFAYEIQIITQGEGVLITDQGRLQVSSGDCILMEKKLYHSIFGLNNDFRRRCFRFRFTDRKTRSDLTEENELRNMESILAPGFGCRVLSNSTDILSLAENIAQEIESMPPFYYLHIKNLFSSIILILLRELAPKHLVEIPLPTRVKDEQRILLIEKFFDNYHTNLQADDLASLLSVSSRQLARIMQELYHTTFKQKLLEVRMEVAKDLLKGTQFSIADIAERVGYLSAKNFSLIFKKKTGESPKEYRDRVRSR